MGPKTPTNDFSGPEPEFTNSVKIGFNAVAIKSTTSISGTDVYKRQETDVVNDAIREMARNVAMQAAALKPLYTNRNEVDADYIAKEKEILAVAARNEKPDANDKIIEGMVMGRINKELKEICLLDQVYVKAEDGKQTVGKYVEEVAKANGAKIAIKKFVRFETGEGMEKKEEDFAAEVAKQMGQ